MVAPSPNLLIEMVHTPDLLIEMVHTPDLLIEMVHTPDLLIAQTHILSKLAYFPTFFGSCAALNALANARRYILHFGIYQIIISFNRRVRLVVEKVQAIHTFSMYANFEKNFFAFLFA